MVAIGLASWEDDLPGSYVGEFEINTFSSLLLGPLRSFQHPAEQTKICLICKLRENTLIRAPTISMFFGLWPTVVSVAGLTLSVLSTD